MKEEICKKVTELFKGEITISKREFIMALALCLFTGITFGLMKAPFTHGVKIGSDNGRTFINSADDKALTKLKDQCKKEDKNDNKQAKKKCCHK